MDRSEFDRYVGELYARLYDLVYLRGHPLADLLPPVATAPRKEKGWRLHDLLLEVIKELDPGPDAPAFSREWRRYRLMAGRYTRGLDPGAVMQEIAVSRRQFYREHEAAIVAAADLLWERCLNHMPARPAAVPSGPAKLDPLEAARLDAARGAQAGRFSRPDEVIRGALALLDERLRQRRLTLRLSLPDPLPGVLADKAPLRQLLLGVIGYLIERAEAATLQLDAQVEANRLYLSVVADPPQALRATSESEMAERLAAFAEMAALAGSELGALREGTQVVGFEIGLALETQRAVLVVDDNEDVLELARRYLALHDYTAITATSAEQAIELAARLQPFAIVLDLMLPGQDGWDALQALLNRPSTGRIPVVICSVLKQKELALSLGATAFLEKPLTEDGLVGALQALELG
jgi:CheY-like chemotaxis protein